jgi:HEAT repeat protein
MLKITKIMAAGLVMAALTGAALAGEQAGDDIDKNIVVLKNWKGADAERLIAAAEALGKKGPAAAKAVPDLIASFDATPAVRQAAINALAKIGAEAVGPVVELLKSRGRGDILSTKHLVSPSETGQLLAAYGIEVLVKMDRQVQKETAIPALKALKAQNSSRNSAKLNAHHALALMDPDVRTMHSVLENTGPSVRPPIEDKTFQNATDSMTTGWSLCYQIARGKPDEKYIPVLVNAIRDSESGMVRYLGMALDRLGGSACVPSLLELLDEEDWYPRWAATAVLEMMGDKAEAALPALEKAFKDDREDIGVRVGAARAIARIRRADPFDLYKLIPNVAERIIKASRDKSMARRQEFMLREDARGYTDIDRSRPGITALTLQPRCLYSLATSQNVDAANAWIRNFVETNMDLGWKNLGGGMNLVRILVMFNSKSSFFPGRLKPDTEAALKEYFYKIHVKRPRFAGLPATKSAKILMDLVSGDRAYHILDPSNVALRHSVRDYLTVSVLKDDPEYQDRKSEYGDTVTECYEAWNRYFRRAIKDWSLHGLWRELGSTNYEYRTYSALFNLVDLAPDPVVRQRARMWLDLSTIEIEQISISGVRGGSKSRAKNKGLGSRFNPQLSMLYGERGILTDQGQLANSQYQPPEAAILLRKLGPPVPTFEIVNRHAGEEGEPRSTYLLHSHNINYAYRTPDYVIGCAMFNTNRKYQAGSEGRWSGVIFRDLAAISLDPYTGEKWNVHSKDVMIAQRFSGSYYLGRPTVGFTAGFETIDRDGWLFVSNDEAFAAVKVVTGGYVWDRIGGSHSFALRLNDEFSPIIIQTGRASDYGSFEKFQEAILKAPLKLRYTRDDSRYDRKRLVKIEYTGPNSSRLEFFADRYNQPSLHFKSADGELAEDVRWFWQLNPDKDPFILPKIDGKTIDLDLESNYKSPYMQCKTGSDIVTVRYGSRRWDYDFAKNAVAEVAE